MRPARHQQRLELLRVDHVPVAEETAFEQLLAVVARDDQDRIVPHALGLEARDQLAEPVIGVGDRVPVCLAHAARVGGVDFSARQGSAGHAVGDAGVVVRKVRRLEVEVGEVRRRAPVLGAQGAVEGGEEVALVDQQAALGGEVERALVPQGLGVDVDVGVGLGADHVGNAAEVLRLP